MLDLSMKTVSRVFCAVLLLAIATNLSAAQTPTPERAVLLMLRGEMMPPPLPPGGLPPGVPVPTRRFIPGQTAKDTLFIDRFEWLGDTLRGRFDVPAEGAHIDYLVLFAPDNMVRLMITEVHRPNHPDTTDRNPRTRIVFQGDSLIMTTKTGVKRMLAGRNAIPMFPAWLGVYELVMRRAQAHGGSTVAPIFWISSGEMRAAPFMARPFDRDSLDFVSGGSITRYRVDAVGRILGGYSPNGMTNPLTLRGTPDWKDAPINTVRDSIRN